jgi:hypothetical protein
LLIKSDHLVDLGDIISLCWLLLRGSLIPKHGPISPSQPSYYLTGTLADTAVESKVAGLNQVILAYLCATTQNLKSGSGLPVLLNGPARNQGPARHIGMLNCTLLVHQADYPASAPSLQLAVDMLSDLADGVQNTANAYGDALERLVDGSVITVESNEDHDESPSRLMAKSSLLFSKSSQCEQGLS